MTLETFFVVKNRVMVLDFSLRRVVSSSVIKLSRYLSGSFGKWGSAICTRQLTSEVPGIHHENVSRSYHRVLQQFP